MLGLGAAIVGILVLWALRQAGKMSPQQSRRFARQIGGYGLCGGAALMALRGNFLIAVPAFTLGAGLLGFNGVVDQFKPNGASGPTMPVDRQQAYTILGLKSGASADEINAAYKRLQRATHPDAGGSNFLAAQINAARDILLKG